MLSVLIMLSVQFNANAQEKPFSDILSQPEFSILQNFVSESDLLQSKKSSGGYTFFAPTNDAFMALGEEKLKYLYANPNEFAKILSYHLVSSKVYASDLSDGQIVTMRDGTDAFISLFDGKAYINQANIIKTDVRTYYGVIHVIDAVITQPKSILDLIAINPRLTWLLEAIYAAGLDELLSSTGYFTIFAPSDEAWQKYQDKVFGNSGNKSAADYSDLLGNHTLEIETYSNDLFDGDIIQTLAGMNIKVTVNQDGVHLNDAKMIYSDFNSPNGVLHIVDKVILEESNVALGINNFSDVIGETNVYPNPATSRTSVSIELKESSEIDIELYDLTGKIVKRANFGMLLSGFQTMDLAIDDLDAGLYIMNIKTGSASVSKKLRIE